MRSRRRIFLLSILLLTAACGAVKERRTIEAPSGYAEAQTASLEELVQLINQKFASVDSIRVSRFDVEFTGERVEEGYLEKYRKAKGILVAEAPDSIFVNILNPLTSTTVLTMASQAQRFQLWIPSRNQYVTGSTEVKSGEENPIYNVRPAHFLNGILVEKIPVDNPDYSYSLEEDQDGHFKYYVLTILKSVAGSSQLSLVRKIWVERSRLQLIRQQYYQGPAVVGIITYAQPFAVEDHWLNSQIKIERPLDRYTIRFEFEKESVELNRENPAVRFQIDKPPDAELVILAEEGEGGR